MGTFTLLNLFVLFIVLPQAVKGKLNNKTSGQETYGKNYVIAKANDAN